MRYVFGEYELNVPGRELKRRQGEETVAMPTRLFTILQYLIEHRDCAVSRDELFQQFWPNVHIQDSGLTRSITRLRRCLDDDADQQRIIKVIRGYGYRFVAAVTCHPAQLPVVTPTLEVRPIADTSRAPEEDIARWPGGAVSLASPLYLERPTDAAFHAALARHESIVLVKGARQVGKTSLLARGLDQARQAGCQVVLTDFQQLHATELASSQRLYQTLGEMLAEQLDLEVFPHDVYQPRLGPSDNFKRYLRRNVLPRVPAQLVWAWDEVDRLFPYPCSSEVFGFVRALHNARALEPHAPWGRLTFAMAYATEAHLFITDVNQSPFNVGTRLTLDDFTGEQVARLNHLYGAPLRDDAEVTRFYRLVGGHPYLVRRGLHAMVTEGLTLDGLVGQAEHDEGPFGDHLRRLLVLLTRNEELCSAVRAVLQGRPCPTPQGFYHLSSGGVLLGSRPQEARLRCDLYARYLGGHL